jgi:nicotinamidase-related amidase
MDPITLNPQTTALVLIDLQQGIAGNPTEPRPGPEVVKNAVRLADRLRELGGTVILVHVDFHDPKERLNVQVDAPAWNTSGQMPANWSEIVPELGPREGDVVITKRQWGAFYGTDLDLQLRRRGIKTIVLGGISTNYGCESTARDAYERGYEQVFVEDAMASRSADAHAFTFQNIFPRIGRVRSTEEVLEALLRAKE